MKDMINTQIALNGKLQKKRYKTIFSSPMITNLEPKNNPKNPKARNKIAFRSIASI